ncbi:uncharacterized protein [Cicer arietinum]|uniref:Transcription factor MYB101 n=1 Tax=Cicer arietinum TaxID=3827 RepID=A0A1S2XFZ6_CICAR|nr:transcription factor MYB101 [Cicer arietinum]
MISNNKTNSNNKNIEVDNEQEDDARNGIKKGPWTPQEDMILIEYVNKHGEGNWNSVQKNSGLLRCGKSCRLRWANHLRPNLKKGAFSEEEEKIIIELHAKLGNKWARMAAQLPGRTDNEIKNFWNTRMKRRQRAGLPLYPPEIHAEAIAYNNHLMQQQQKYDEPFSSSSSLSFSLLLSSCYPKKLNDQNHYNHPLQNQNNSADSANNHYTNDNPQFNETLALQPHSPYPSSSSTLFNQSFNAAAAAAPSDLSYDHGFNAGGGGRGGGSMYEPFPLVPGGSNTEISSSQTTIDSSSPASSMVNNNDYYEVAPISNEGNSGLLDALVVEGRNLSSNDKSKSEDSNVKGNICYKRKSMESEDSTIPLVSAMKKKKKKKKKKNGISSNEIQKEGFSSSQLSTGKKAIEEDPIEEMNSMYDDDLHCLLNNFPEIPMPEWYCRGKSQSLGIETPTDHASSSSGPTNQEFAWTLGPTWNNMPGIC